MTRLSDDETVRSLREALSGSGVTPPHTDLWPTVRQQIDRGAPAPTITDWIFITLVAIGCLLQPAAVLVPLFDF
jgi:hypothetical protein